MNICLSMMVKNESRGIAASIASVRDFISSWVIVDTGSTDGTQRIAREAMEGIPGKIVERPWVNWGHNRSEAVQLALQTSPDFVFLLDGRELFVGTPPADLNPDFAYDITVKRGILEYTRPNLISPRQSWAYHGVTHEYLASPENPPRILLPGCYLQRDSSKAEGRCAEDAKLLEAALKEDPDNARYAFYLAQSYRDIGELEKSRQWYERRVLMQGWPEEVFVSLREIARINVRLNEPPDTVLASYLCAYRYRPSRAAEVLGPLAQYYRHLGQWHMAFVFAEAAKSIPAPNDQLFVEKYWYDWAALDEYALAAYYTGRKREALEANVQLMGRVPKTELERLTRNLDFCRK